MRAHLVEAIAVCCIVVAAPSCAPAIRSATAEASKSAPPALTDASLRVLEDEPMRRRVAAALATPEMQHALAELSSGLAKGMVDGLGDEQQAARMDAMVARFSHALSTALAAEVHELEPAMKTLVQSAVAGALQEAASPESKAATHRLLGFMVSSIAESSGEAITHTIGPALHKALVDELGPALRETMQKDMPSGVSAVVRSPEVRQALRQATHDIVAEAVFASNAALAELAERERRGYAGPLGKLGAFFVQRTWLAVLLALGVPLVLALAWLLREVSLARRYRQRTERRVAEAAALIEAVEAGEGRPSAKDLLALLKAQLLADDARERTPRAARRGFHTRHA